MKSLVDYIASESELYPTLSEAFYIDAMDFADPMPEDNYKEEICEWASSDQEREMLGLGLTF